MYAHAYPDGPHTLAVCGAPPFPTPVETDTPPNLPPGVKGCQDCLALIAGTASRPVQALAAVRHRHQD